MSMPLAITPMVPPAPVASAPLCAEMIAAHLCGEPAPVSDAISRALSPARFLLPGIVRSNAR